MKIVVIGTGYVGLVSGVCLADTGNEVYCVDTNENIVNKLKNGEITIYEPGLEEIFERNKNRLHFTTKLEDVVNIADIIFLALPTPQDEDGSADLKYVLQVAKDLGNLLDNKKYRVIVDKSTVPVGTADKVSNTIKQNSKIDNIADYYNVVSNPEFLKEGDAIDGFTKPDRIVIGSTNEKATKMMQDLYAPYTNKGNPILIMDERSAELTKYAANAFLAMKISFMNEMAILTEKLGANIDEIRKGIGSDERIGNRFLFPGIGYGGSCFPKDVQALINTSKKADFEFKILNAVINVNEHQVDYFYKKIVAKFDGELTNKKIGVWGLSFKPNTDDIRESASIKLILKLINSGADVLAFDPIAMENVEKIYGNKIKLVKNKYEVLTNADALVIATEWNEFRNPDFELMGNSMKQKVIFDGRNIYKNKNILEVGFDYHCVGR